MFKFRYLLLCACACSLLNCGDHNLAGGGLDTESSGGTVTGSVKLPDGSPAKGARAYCILSTYNAAQDAMLPDSLIRETDESGTYRFDHIKQGVYNIQVVSRDEKSSMLASGINVHRDVITVPTGTLLDNSTLKIVIPDTVNDDYVYLPGTICSARAQNGYALIDNVPAGYIPLLCYVNTADATKNSIIKAGFVLSSRAATTIANLANGEFSKMICLNTTLSGADVAGPVYDFPVVVRLNSGNFIFSQAQADGRDVRFSKTNATPLSFEIERWDPANQLAEIWVKVDTIYGNDSGQSIMMYWGASTMDSTGSPRGAATSVSNGAAVFDTAAGFQGVWHLNDAANDTVLDATVNRYGGVSPDTARPSIGEGVIGNCGVFDGNKDFITMPNTASGKLDFPQGGHYSVSAWVMADTFIDLQQTLVSKGKYQYFLWVGSKSWQFWEYQDRAGWEASAQQATLKQWVLLTGVRDGATQHLYVNGEPTDSISSKSDITPRNTASDLILGRAHESVDSSFFSGNIDEVRVESTARSSAWVRLSYMNQRIDDRLVIFR